LRKGAKNVNLIAFGDSKFAALKWIQHQRTGARNFEPRLQRFHPETIYFRTAVTENQRDAAGSGKYKEKVVAIV